MVVIGNNTAINLDNVSEWSIVLYNKHPEIRFEYGVYVVGNSQYSDRRRVVFNSMEDAKREFIAISRALADGLAVYVINFSSDANEDK